MILNSYLKQNYPYFLLILICERVLLKAEVENKSEKRQGGVFGPRVKITFLKSMPCFYSWDVSQRNLHQYPLHRISYCADDKAEKRFFSFIAKEADSDKHTCFVFVSDKLVSFFVLLFVMPVVSFLDCQRDIIWLHILNFSLFFWGGDKYMI